MSDVKVGQVYRDDYSRGVVRVLEVKEKLAMVCRDFRGRVEGAPFPVPIELFEITNGTGFSLIKDTTL
jgi:hypothetical protein